MAIRGEDARLAGNGLIPEKVLNKLLGEALVNRQFHQRLLADPYTASQRFDLTDEQRAVLSGIKAHTLSDFALQLVLLLSSDGKGNYEPQQPYEATSCHEERK